MVDLIKISIITLFIATFALPAHLFASDADDEENCLEQAEASYKKYMSNIDKKIQELEASTILNASTKEDRVKLLNGQKQAREERYINQKVSCEVSDQRKQIAKNSCSKKNAEAQAQNKSDKTFYEWKDDECVAKFESNKSPSGDGECNNAGIFANGRLKGEKCASTASTIKDVEGRTKAVSETTNTLATSYSAMVAQQSTGAQDNAQNSQKKVMQGLAIAKIISAGNALSGAAQLNSAASEADDANSAMTGAYKQIEASCQGQSNQEACFYANASNYGVPASKAEYANFERLQSGAQESKSQAEKASNLAKAAAISGIADAFVGYQAMQAANQANEQTQTMGSLPIAPAAYSLGGYKGSGQSTGVTVGTPTAPDYANDDAGGLFDAQASAPIRGSMRAGKSFGVNTFTPGKSSVSTGGGGGSLSGGGGGGGKSGASGKRRGSLGDTGVGEYSLGGGLLGSPKAGKEGKPDEANPFADALAKLFPPDKDGKPTVDERKLASLDATLNTYQQEENDPGVEAIDVSIFEQINAKYRQLENSGRI